MPNPVASDLHIDALLTELSLARMNQAEDYVADRAFPIVGVSKQSDKLLEFDDGFFQASEATAALRAPGTLAKEIGYKVTTSATYFCQNFALAHGIPDEDRGNADAVFDLDMQSTMLVTEAIKILRENAFATDFMTTGVWTTDKTGTTDLVKWNDYAASNPIGDIRDGRYTIRTAVGRAANKIVMGELVWERLAQHPDLMDRVKYGASPMNPASVTRQAVAALLELDEILIGQAVKRSSVEGATVTKARIIDDDALLLFTPQNPSRMTPSAGYTFVWNYFVNGQSLPQVISKYRDIPGKRRDVVECSTYFDQKLTMAPAGYFFSDIVD